MNTLAKIYRQRVIFEPNNKEHVAQFRNFMINNRWENGCPFELVWPYLSIPDMIKDQIIKAYLKI
ncbi:MAG: hypothetical protein ACO294_10220 [Methylococcales bacterium]